MEQSVFFKNGIIAKHVVTSRGQSRDGRRIADDNDFIGSLHPDYAFDQLRRQVMPVRNDRGNQIIAGKPGPDRILMAVDHIRDSVSKMCQRARARLFRFLKLFVIGELMPAADRDSQRNGMADQLLHTLVFRGDGHQFDKSAGMVHDLIEKTAVRLPDIRRIVAADGTGLIRKEKKEMSQPDIAYFLNKVGTDMENITKELEKLFCYCLDRNVIVREDVDAICVTQITNHIFDMVNAVAAKDQKRALDLYYDLLALKEPPMRILALMSKEYRDLFHVKELSRQGYGRKDIASKAGLHPFVAGKYMDLAKRFQPGELRKVMEESADLEQRVKTGLITDTLAVELFIVK